MLKGSPYHEMDQFSVAFSVSDVEYTCLCLFWVSTQVVSCIILANVM